MARIDVKLHQVLEAVRDAAELDEELWKEVVRLRDEEAPETKSGERARESLEELNGTDLDDLANGLRELVADVRKQVTYLNGNEWDEAITLVGRAR